MEDVRLYLADSELLGKSTCKKTVEKARGKIEKREYWQSGDISWLRQKEAWKGLKTGYAGPQHNNGLERQRDR